MISETLTYDATAGTLQESGSLTVSPSIGSFKIEGSIFAPGSGFATLTVGNNGVVPFNFTENLTGLQGNSDNSFVFNLPIPVSGAGVFNQQPFGGSWYLELPIVVNIKSLDPNSLTFSESAVSGLVESETVLPNGLSDGASDGTYYYAFKTGPDIAMAVPEPNSFLLLILGLSATAFFLRHPATSNCSHD